MPPHRVILHVCALTLFLLLSAFPVSAKEAFLPANDSSPAHPDDIYWDDGFIFADFDGPVRAVATRGDTLYAGGDFTMADGVPVYGIAMWDGDGWSAMGSGVYFDHQWYDATVRDILIVGETVYIGGRFSHAGGRVARNVARWNGTRWLPLGEGVYSPDQGLPFVYALAEYQGDIYAAGNFRMAGGAEALSVARWNGSAWFPLGNGLRAPIFAAEVWREKIFFVGRTAELIGWDGTRFSNVRLDLGGIAGRLYALAANDTALFFGGDFTLTYGHATVDNIGCWNGSIVQAPGEYSSTEGPVHALAFWQDDLYVGGDFEYAGGLSVNNIRRWDGRQWKRLGMDQDNGANNTVFELAPSPQGLYLAGEFSSTGGMRTSRVARWEDGAWMTFDRGRNNSVNGTVTCMAISNNVVTVGGRFTRAGDAAAVGVAQWDRSSWRRLGSGIPETWMIETGVKALQVVSDTVYAGGEFYYAGGVDAKSLAMWDGEQWQEWGGGAWIRDYLGNWKEGRVYALTAHGSDVYIGGYFHKLGYQTIVHIAQWSGAGWEALGGGLSVPEESGIRSLTMHGDDVIVGGRFNPTSGIMTHNIGGWTGSEWYGLADGIDGWVWALTSDGTNLYAGGEFLSASGREMENVGWWDGREWLPLGQGLNGIVRGLAVLDGELYATGDFTMSGAAPLNHIARWNGTEWLPLGSGLDRPGLALAARGRELFVGGEFLAAGGKPSNHFARWILPGTVIILDFAAWSEGEAVGMSWNIFSNTDLRGAVICRADCANGDSVMLPAEGMLDAALRDYVDTSVGAGREYEYVLVIITDDGSEVRSDPVTVTIPTPPLALLQNYPNPFTTETTIEFTMPWRRHAVLSVYDVAGRLVATLEDGIVEPGRWRVVWDGTGSGGRRLPTGIYFCRLNTAQYELTRKLLISR